MIEMKHKNAPGTVKVHPTQVETMKSRGWVAVEKGAKPRKSMKPEETKDGNS